LKVLVVKLSSLGDVVHAMPAVQDIRARLPKARIDWVVERAFAPLVERCAGVEQVVECELRRWRHAPLARQTRTEWRSFKAALQANEYDAVIDLQGLTKSAWIAWHARLSPGGKRYAMANRTDGSSYEAPTRWVADVALKMEPHLHAVQRSREVCAMALGYELPSQLQWGLAQRAALRRSMSGPTRAQVVLVHGTSRDDKLWPVERWKELASRITASGYSIGLPHGSAEELERSKQIAAAVEAERPGMSSIWPRMGLDLLTDRMARMAGAIGVDSGLSHIAVALDLPHVQLYNFDTAWRTGPSLAMCGERQVSLFDPQGPSVDAVWEAWRTALGSQQRPT